MKFVKSSSLIFSMFFLFSCSTSNPIFNLSFQWDNSVEDLPQITLKDSHENIIVLGRVMTSALNNVEYQNYLAKIGPDLKLISETNFIQHSMLGIAAATIDSDDNIYVLSRDEMDGNLFNVTKLTTAGDIIWDRAFKGQNARDIVTDNNGNLYITGSVNDSTAIDAVGNHDITVIKLTDDATPLWERLYGTADNDFGAQLAFSGDGNLIVAGETDGQVGDIVPYGGPDIILIKVDTEDGTSLWMKQYSSSESINVKDLVISSTEGIFVGCESVVNDTESNIFVTKTDSAGIFQFSTYHMNSGIEQLKSLIFDPIQNLRIVGETNSYFDGTSNSGGFDIFMFVLDDRGFITKSYEWGDSTDNKCGGATIVENDLYISGTNSGSKKSYYDGINYDFVLYKFDF